MSSERGNRLIHFEVVGLDGRSEVAVVGREKSPRHLSFAVVPQFLMHLGEARRVRLKTKKEVADWLDSVVAGELWDSLFFQIGVVIWFPLFVSF